MTSPKRRLRRDARERREALITAAAECFAKDGYGVALETIADKAGVGRGTLYRNFPDRAAITVAIFSRQVDRLEDLIDPSAPIAETIANMARECTAASALFARIAAELRLKDPNLTAFHAIGERLQQIIEPAVVQAQHRGELDATLTAKEIVLAMRMAGGVLRSFMSDAEITLELDAALQLLIHGLRPR